jgi:hypothetical protein
MKKVYLFFSILMLSTVAFAQHVPKFGLKAGVNFANWSSENDVENDLRTGFHVGGLAHIHLAPEWALQPELQYSSQGTKTDLGSLGEFTWKLDYINVPVMVQYMFNNGFRLEAGPQLGFLVDAKQIDDDDHAEEIDDEFKKTDVSLGFGANYLTYSGFGIGARYNLGLTDINKERTFETKNRVLQVSVFYMFDSQHKAKSR